MPARGGSKGLPGKNLMTVGDRSLVAWAVTHARDSGVVDRVVLTTDDDAIEAEGRRWGAEVVRRPEELASDGARTIDALVHALDALGDVADVDLVVLLQPTSPLRTPDDVTACIARVEADDVASVVSVCEVDHHPYKDCVVEDGRLVPVHELADLEAPRQHLPRALRPNGAVYVSRAGDLRGHRRFFVAPVGFHEMSVAASIDVDGADDLDRVRAVFSAEA